MPHFSGGIIVIAVLPAQHYQYVKYEWLLQQLQLFLQKNGATEIDLLISGENGDNRTLPFYADAESLLPDDASIIRFKHLCGEFATASAIGLWYACEILQTQKVPAQMFKKKSSKTIYRNILLYNNFKGYQHSFMLISTTQISL